MGAGEWIRESGLEREKVGKASADLSKLTWKEKPVNMDDLEEKKN